MKKKTSQRKEFISAVRSSFIEQNREIALRALSGEADDADSRKIRKNFLDSAELDAEIRARFPQVHFFTELGRSGIDYSDAVPTLKYWLDRTKNQAVKVEIAKLLAFPEFGASENLARALHEVASNDKSESGFPHDFDVQALSQFLIRSMKKKDGGTFVDFAADPSLPIGARWHFLEAMARRKDPRAVPILRELLASHDWPGMTLSWLKLFRRFKPDDLREVALKLTSHPIKAVREAAEEILEAPHG